MLKRQKLVTVYFSGVTIALVAWILNATHLYWMAGALFLLPSISRLFGLLEHRGLAVEREGPHVGHQGDTMTVRLHVENRSPIPRMHLSVADELPVGLAARDPAPVPVHLPPRGADTAEYVLQLRRRGVHTLRAARVASTDLLGVYELESRVPVETSLLVYPRVLELPGGVLPPVQSGGQAPLELSGRQGEGSSFFGIREYRPGDPLRHVHWRTAARLGRLAVVEWEAEESLDALVAVDTGRESVRELEGGTTLDLAAGLTASLAASLLARGASLRLLVPGAAERRHGAVRGSESLPAMLETLARMQPGDQEVAAELRQVAPQLAPGTVVCWVTAAPDETLLSTARYLRAAGFRLVVYLLSDLPAGKATPWEAAAAGLQSLQIPLIRLHQGDDLVQRLLS